MNKPSRIIFEGQTFVPYPDRNPADNKICKILLHDSTVVIGIRKMIDSVRCWYKYGTTSGKINDSDVRGWWYNDTLHD